MKVLVTDYTFGELIVETAVLAPLGVTPIGAQCKTPADLLELVRDADYVITQFAPINREVIEAMQQSRIIVRYGIGVDNVDLEAAQERGIPVCNVPDYCIDEVADHTLAFILAGGSLPHQTMVSEQYLLDLEREAFLKLCGEPKTLERIHYTLKTGKTLRN